MRLRRVRLAGDKFYTPQTHLGLEISSNLIESLFMGNKTTVWEKFVIKIPREGTKDVFKYQSYTYAHIPSPHLNVDICITNTT